jgi:predicted ATP-dependent endonuclease of OLD family
VNALVIEDNLVGKSSVLKTIKFALTGNDDEYDQEVRRWITDV